MVVVVVALAMAKTLIKSQLYKQYENPFIISERSNIWNPYWKSYETHIETHIENHIETHLKIILKTFFIQTSSWRKLIGLQGAALRSALMELMKAKAILGGGGSRLGPGEKPFVFKNSLKGMYILS